MQFRYEYYVDYENYGREHARSNFHNVVSLLNTVNCLRLDCRFATSIIYYH